MLMPVTASKRRLRRTCASPLLLYAAILRQPETAKPLRRSVCQQKAGARLPTVNHPLRKITDQAQKERFKTKQQNQNQKSIAGGVVNLTT